LKSVAFTVPPSLIPISYFFPVRLSTIVKVPAPPEKLGAISDDTVNASSIGEQDELPDSKWLCKIDSLFEADISEAIRVCSISAKQNLSDPKRLM